jgi:hypothetical protein
VEEGVAMARIRLPEGIPGILGPMAFSTPPTTCANENYEIACAAARIPPAIRNVQLVVIR